MGDIVKKLRPAYYAPTRCRHYATALSAAKGEAWALIKRKYGHRDNSYDLDRAEYLNRLQRRLTRIIYGAFLQSKRGDPA